MAAAIAKASSPACHGAIAWVNNAANATTALQWVNRFTSFWMAASIQAFKNSGAKNIAEINAVEISEPDINIAIAVATALVSTNATACRLVQVPSSKGWDMPAILWLPRYCGFSYPQLLALPPAADFHQDSLQ